MRERIGRTFGDFLVKEQIGQGGSGEVYRAEQVTLGREAVLKLMARGSEPSANSTERFLREARLASRLDHPFAAHVYAFGAEPDGTLWIAMELVRGTPLNTVLATSGPMALAYFVPFFERLCEVVNAAHEQGIVHRDIKPANVMVLRRAGRVLPKLLDLGIARSDAPTQGAADVEAFDDRPLSDTITQSGSLLAQLTKSESMHLTQVGAVVGTPHFMAPEQWLNASTVDAGADVYALALVAWQCLMGQLPFEGKSLRAMAKAHLQQPLPSLSDALPAALNAALQKGAAKKAADRHASALELAAEVRAASGLGIDEAPLPTLPEGLRENLLGEAPQPISEAIALLESARTARQAIDAVAQVASTLCRYLGLTALAARLKVGQGSPPQLQRLFELGLTNAQWLELAAALLRPFAATRDAHPLPELVRYFWSGEAHTAAPVATLERLLNLEPPARGAGDVLLSAYLHDAVAALAKALDAASVLFDYALVVVRDDPERWMGTRRLKRPPHRLAAGVKLSRGDVLLADAAGMPAVRLSPLVRAEAPSAGAPEELFFLEGRARHGARFVAWPAAYERHDDAVWGELSAAGLAAQVGDASREETEPYKGLSTFSPNDADRYFGREAESEAFANRLRVTPFLAVVGPSGTGKSSFVLAGVLPRLPAHFRSVVLRPGASPMSVLTGRLHAAGLWASTDVGELAGAVARRLGDEGALLLVVDQFEEAVTLCADAEQRQALASTLLALARHESGRVRVVVTLRDDFLIKVGQVPALQDALSSSLQLLGTPAREQLLRVVTEPARRAGFQFDDAELPRRMVDAVAETPGALALLSFTASQLWELRDRHLKMMRAKTYQALGGVGGALAHHAETTLAAMPPEQGALVREAFRHLVTAQGTRAVLTKDELKQVLGAKATADAVIAALVDARLLVTSETAEGVDHVEIIHEALIVAWPRLVAWRRDDAEAARVRDALRASARQWAERGRPSGLLWRDETLTEFRLWKARFGGKLTVLEEEFSGAALREEARSRALRRGLGAAAFAVLAVGLVVVLNAYRQADAAATDAREKLLTLRREQGRLAVLGGHPLEALAYLAEGRPEPTTSQYEHLSGTATWLASGTVAAFRTPGPVADVATDGSSVVAFGYQGGLWVDLASGATMTLPKGRGAFAGPGRLLLADRTKALHELSLDGGVSQRPIEVGVGVIDPGGPSRFSFRSELDGRALVLDQGTSVIVEEAKGAPVIKTVWEPGGTRVAAFASQVDDLPNNFLGVTVYDTATKKKRHHELGSVLVRAAGFGGPCEPLVGTGKGELACLDGGGTPRWTYAMFARIERFALDRTRCAAIAGGRLAVVSLATGQAAWSAQLSTEALVDVAWAGTDELLVGRRDGTVLKVDAATGNVVWTYSVPASAVNEVGWSAAQKLGIAGSTEGTLNLLDLSKRSYETVIPSGVRGVWADAWDENAIVFSDQGWLELESGKKLLPELTEHGGFGAAGSSRNGQRVALSEDAKLWVLDRATGKIVLEAATPATVQDLWLDAAGARVAAFMSDGRLSLLDVASGRATVLSREGHQLGRGFFSPDGQLLNLPTDKGLLLQFGAGDGSLVRERQLQTEFYEFRETADPAVVVTTGIDGKVGRWRAQTLEPIVTVQGAG